MFRISAGQTTVKSVGTFSSPSSLADAGGVLYFADTGTKVYQVGPTDASAHLVGTVAAGVSGAAIGNFVGVGNALYFTLRTLPGATYNYELWTVPDWQSQPQAVAPLSSARFVPMSFVAAGSRVVFVCDDASSGWELWSSDGTPWGTGMIRDWFPGTAESNPFFSRQVGDKLMFWANDGVNGSEPMTLDAFGNLTSLGDLNPGRASSYAYGSALVGGDQLILTATTAAAGRELWVTDGTPGGTLFLKDIYAGVSDSAPAEFVEYHGKVYFSATDAAHGLEMWVTDGTTAGTTLFRDGIAGSGSGGFNSGVVMNDVLYFVSSDSLGGSELWRTDGTVAGTSRVKDIYAGSTGSAPSGLTVSGGVLYFSATTSAAGTELWRSDGTEAGTRMVKDVYAGGKSSVPATLTAGPGGTVFFQATDASGKTAWRSDGTDAGTIRLSTIAVTPGSFTEMDGSVYFFASNAAKGVDLWRSDGTIAGTVLVKVIAPPPTTYTPFTPTALMVLNGRMFFLGDDGFTGRELWSSDGTAAGTACVQDLAPGGMQGVSSTTLATLDGAIYVSGDNSLYGFEPWRFADEYAPVAWRQSTDFNGGAGYDVTFNEAINPPMATDVVLTNLTTGQVIAPDQLAMAYDTGTHVLRLTFPGYLHGMPPDGDYRLTFAPGVLADVAGNTNAEAMDFSFFVLAGDANHDRAVDFNDLVRLAQNYNTFGGKTFAEGDFNFDGNVDFNDLVILAQRYNTSLAAAPAPAMAVAVATKKSLVPDLPPPVVKKPAVVKKPVRSPFAAAGRVR